MKNNYNKLEDKLTDVSLLGIGCLVTGATLLVSPLFLVHHAYKKIREKFDRKYKLEQEAIRARRHLDYVCEEATNIQLSHPSYNARQAIETAQKEYQEALKALQEFQLKK